MDHEKIKLRAHKTLEGAIRVHYGELDGVIAKLEEYRIMSTLVAAATAYTMLGERIELVASALEEAGFDPPLWYEHTGEKYTYTGCDALPFFVEEYANLIRQLAQTEATDTVIHPRTKVAAR